MTRKIKEAEVVFATKEHSSPNPQEITDAGSAMMVGCLRGTMAGCVSVMLALFAGISVGIKAGWFLGVMTGTVLFLVFISVSVYLMNTAKQLTVSDCILPLPIGVVSALLFTPVGFISASLFSTATCLGSAFFLTMMLFLYRAKKIYGGFLVIPFFVFLYEMLPIELPTDLDNFLCLGGNGVNFVFSVTFDYIKRKLLP